MLISLIVKPFIHYLVLIIIVMVKMTYAIFLEMSRGFWKLYCTFAQIWFLWIYDVIMTSRFANVLDFQALWSKFDPFIHSNGKNNLFYLLENFPRIPKIIFEFRQNFIFMDLWRQNDVTICQGTQFPSLLIKMSSFF